jgi:hypothetical protein
LADVWRKLPLEGEEGEDSFRLDHENFQDVYRTVYRKGNITDFRLASENPIKPDAMVKVQVDGYEESDYIPLFFTPKEGFWDNSTSVNAEEGYFEDAWMSFRVGDEVVIMLQADEEDELKPVRVCGFADNYPRIGENVFQLDYEEYSRSGCSGSNNSKKYKCTQQSIYPSDVGPDGLSLQLFENYEFIGSKEATEEIEWAYTDATERTHYSPFKTMAEFDIDVSGTYMDYHWEPDPPPNSFPYIYGQWVCDGFAYVNIYKKDYPYTYRVHEYAIVVGPILYLISALSRLREHTKAVRSYELYGCGEVTFRCPGHGCYTDDSINTNPQHDTPVDRDPEGDGANTQWTVSTRVKAGIYTEDLMAAIKGGATPNPLEAKEIWENGGDWTREQEGLYSQSGWTGIVAAGCADPETYELLVRPHTWEELVEAGLLNDDGSLPLEEGE